MKNALVLTTSYPRFNGDFAGSFVKTYSEKFLKDYKIEVICPSTKNANDSYEQKVSIHRFNYFIKNKQSFAYGDGIPDNLKKKSVLFQLPFFLFFYLLKAIDKAKNTDMIVSHWLLPSGVIGSLIHLLFGVKHKCIIHGGDFYLSKKIFAGKLLRKFVYKNSFAVEVVSQKILDEIKNETKTKVSLLELPLETEGYDLTKDLDETYSKFGLVKEKGIVLCLARLIKLKGVEFFIRAAQGLDNLQFIVAGDGEEENALKELAKELGVKVHFFSNIFGQDKWDLLRLSKIVVIPSIKTEGREEGTPIIALESLFLGKKVIASRVGGLEKLFDKLTLVEEKDFLEIRKKIGELVD